MAKVECLIERSGSTQIFLEQKEYNFVEDRHGRKVAEIPNQAHVQYLISGGNYRLVEDAPESVVSKVNEVLESGRPPTHSEITGEPTDEDIPPAPAGEAIGHAAIRKEFLYLKKPEFLKWIENNTKRIGFMPQGIKNEIRNKWDRCGTGKQCPIA